MPVTLKETVLGHIRPHVVHLISEIDRQKEMMILDGVRVFSGEDKFLPGKAAVLVCYLFSNQKEQVSNQKEQAGHRPLDSEMVKEMLTWLSGMYTETWGSLYFINGLYLLQQAGLLDVVLTPETEAVLKEKLDWRKFVNIEEFSLIEKPTNYYGVAFGIAKFREMLGWENEGFSEKILDHLMGHISEFSSGNGFMDETKGEGRFDRYSVLLPGELAALLSSTGVTVPETILAMLRKSSEICLALANERGDGFSYGRSIGPYGDTCPLEVLSIAALLGVLSPEEKKLAYSYSIQIVQKFTHFWLDSTTNSVNMWDGGRATDEYRHKGRILGENLSLSWQLIRCMEHWKDAGFTNTSLLPDFRDRLEQLPKKTLYHFASGEYARALAIIRDREHVFSLPMINGGSGTDGGSKVCYYYSTPYLPVPSEDRVLEAAPGSYCAYFVPKITLTDGSELMPISFMRNIQETESGSIEGIRYELPELCLIGEAFPRKDSRLKGQIEYSFDEGAIQCQMKFTSQEKITIKEVYMEAQVFSDSPAVEDGIIRFTEGSVSEIRVDGLDLCKLENINDHEQYNAPHGALQWNIGFKRNQMILEGDMKITWTMKYN